MSSQCHRCLEVTNDVHTCTPTAEFGALEARIAELEAELDEWQHGERTYPNYNEDYKEMCRKAVAAEQEVARLSAHIRAIAEHHKNEADEAYRDFYGDELYHTERRDFALSIFTQEDE